MCNRPDELLRQKLNEKKVLVAVHRGSSGGNIIENTKKAFEVALKYGGDIVEMDIANSTDGKYYVIHDGQEERLFFLKDNVKALTSLDIEALAYRNGNSFAINQRVERLEDVLGNLKGHHLINVDRCCEHWNDIYAIIAKLGMLKQVIFKSAPEPYLIDIIKGFKEKVTYFPIVRTLDEIEDVLTKGIPISGLEILITEPDSIFFNKEVIQGLKDKGLMIWLNAIVLNDRDILMYGCGDDVALTVDEDKGWGTLVDLGADIIQTDWPLHLSLYLKSRIKKVN